MKKIPLQFHEWEYSNAVMFYTEKTDLQKLLTAELKKQLSGTAPAEFDFTDAEQEFYKQLELRKADVNSLGLKGNKLAEVLSLSVDEIKRLQSKVTELKHVVLPTIEDFTVYAETDAEIKKYNECINVIKAIGTVKDVLVKIKGQYFHQDLIIGFRPLLSWNLTTSKFEPNVQYIKASDV